MKNPLNKTHQSWISKVTEAKQVKSKSNYPKNHISRDKNNLMDFRSHMQETKGKWEPCPWHQLCD